MARRVRLVAGLWALAELLVFALVASWIGVGWTILLALATSALGWLLLARQGVRALADLRERARTRQRPQDALGDAGLVAVGGLMMVLPGFLGDVVGLLCLLPGTRRIMRAALARVIVGRLPEALRGPVRVQSARTVEVTHHVPPAGTGSTASSLYLDGRVVDGEVVEGEVLDGPDRRAPGR